MHRLMRSPADPVVLLYLPRRGRWRGVGAPAGILECVRLSAGLCLDKAACPLSLMAQLGGGPHRHPAPRPGANLSPRSEGKKRAWIPDEKEAYIQIEIKELKGDKVIVETKDGRVGRRACAGGSKLGL
ncbi:unnamed protein product [Tetraodon nigroviridis]|uniref:(spotted green pufferfish) hypothetical protein n=1 Tax=Tetraodon nigroviridis TaxID=99883 RepID=Q4SR68_TETNG|nr:unnamed protein product [Tetraodon nigroviridis]